MDSYDNDASQGPPVLDEVELAEMRAAEAREKREAELNATTNGPTDIPSPGGRQFAAVEAGENDAADREDRVGQLRRETQIPMNFVIERLQQKLDGSELYLDLLIFVPFLIMFVFFFMSGRDTEANFYVMQGIRNQYQATEYPSNAYKMAMFRQQMAQGMRLWVELDKGYFDMGNQGDYQSYLTDAFIPTTYNCGEGQEETYPTNAAFRSVRGQTLLLGATRFRTIRARINSCEVDKGLYPKNRSLFPGTCYAIGFDGDVEDTGPFCTDQKDLNGNPLFVYRGCSSVPGVPLVGYNGVYHCGGYMFEIPFNQSCKNAMEIANQAMGNDQCTFNDQWGTRLMVTEFFAYSPLTDSFHSIKLFQEVDASGWWRMNFLLRSFQVWSPKMVPQLVFELFFLLFVLYYWVVYVYNLVKAYQSSETLSYLLAMWNVLELANLVCFMVVFGVRFTWIAKSREANIQFPLPNTYPKNLDALQTLYDMQVMANSVNTLLTFLKVLKYVRLSSMLGILTRTLAMCQQSIAGVLVLFALVVLSYAIAGWSLFGVNMEEYRTLGIAIASSLQVLVGDSNYEDMRRTNRFLAGLYFWSYLILGLFLLLNFIIAILSDSFAKVSGRAFAQSFEELLIRFVQNMQAFLVPSNVKRIVRGLCSGNSEPKLIRQVISQLEERKKVEEGILQTQRDEKLKQLQEMEAASADPNAQNKDTIFQNKEQFQYDPMLDGDEEIIVNMRHADLEAFVDPQTFDLLTQHFFDYTWDEMMNDYDDAKKTSEEVDKRLMFDKVSNGVMRVVGDDLQKIEQLDEVLTTLEKHVREMIETIQKK